MQNRRLDPTGLAKPGESHRLTGTGPGLDSQEAAGRVFGRFWNRTKLFFLSKPRPLVGHLDLLLTLNVGSLQNINTSSPSMQPLTSSQHCNTILYCSHRCCSHGCFGQCCTLHTCTAWSVPCNVPHIMVSVLLLGIPAIDAAASMVYMLQTATIVGTAAVMGHLGFLKLLPFIALHLQLEKCRRFLHIVRIL